MIRRLLYCLMSALALASACTKTTGELEGDAGIEISVFCADAAKTRADSGDTQDGENRYNENLISTVDFFFYPGENPDRDADAVYHVRRESGQRGSDVFLIDVTKEDVNNCIFPSSPNDIRKATVFAIANWPGGALVTNEDNLSGTSLNTLENLEVETDFVLTAPENYANLTPQNYKQDKFLMSGKIVLDLRSRTANIAATGAVRLIRHACKLTVSVSVAESVTLGESVWEPMLEDMTVYLVHGVNTVKLGGEDPVPHYFSYVDNPRKFAYIDAQDGDKVKPLVSKTGDYYNSHPMYMYPQHWNYGQTDGTDDIEPYLKLELPWHRTTTGGYSSTQKQCYYKIFIPDDTRGDDYIRHFVRNNWYHLDIDVGLLGADTDDAAMVLTGSFYMVPWQNVDMEIERKADIGKARYLSVDRTIYDLHNVNETDIRYTTSHPLVITDVQVTCPYYGTVDVGQTARGGTVRKDVNGDIYPAGTKYLEFDTNNGEGWLTNTGTAIHFSHSLHNDFTQADFDYSPYTVTFTIAHYDKQSDARYRKTITVRQSPAIFIESLLNSDDTFVKRNQASWSGKTFYDSEHWGYVYVDGRQIVRPHRNQHSNNIADYMVEMKAEYPDDEAVQNFSQEDMHWRVVWYTGGSRDIFKIDITVPPDDSELLIGDPRTDTYDLSYRGQFKEADAVEGGTRSLMWYYPAENSDRTVNMMAPSFRIASKCGGVEFDDVTMQQAQYRCATYQEDGFPAGRWRLPTKGEIQFIASLSSNKVFDYLFSTANYWSANGAVRVEKESGHVTESTATKALPRCVYDTWYWGDDQMEERDHFYWGDQEEK